MKTLEALTEIQGYDVAYMLDNIMMALWCAFCASLETGVVADSINNCMWHNWKYAAAWMRF